MKDYYRKAGVIAGILLGIQMLAFLFSDISSITVLFSIAASLIYLVNTGDVKVKEAVTGTVAFLVSSFALSSLGKIFILDRLCKTTRTGSEIGSVAEVLRPETVCQGFFEAWFRTLTTNPVYNWYFWVGTLGTGILAAYAYRKYYE